MRLFIAEKPQLGQVIAEALGGGQRRSGSIQCGADVVTWCVGHLLELAPPQAHNPAYVKWNAADLPLKLRPVKYQPIAGTSEQLGVVGQLIGEADEIVHAGDPDEEGQLLVDEVLAYFGNTRPVKRVLINDLNAAAARKALGNLRENSEFRGLSLRGQARSIADQLYGFNLTRAYSLAAQARGGKGVLSVGRVQTPILGLIVSRYLSHTSHSASYYFNVLARLEFSALVQARLVVAEGAPVDEKGRILDEDYAQGIAQACRGAAARVRSVVVEEKTQAAPLPFSLLDLQAQMSRAHGIDAEKTLAITQALREKYKAITYNRSDCNYLTVEQHGEAAGTFAALAQSLPDMQKTFVQADPGRKGRAFNDAKVSAHTAIIPTAVVLDMKALSTDEQTVYLAIVRQYVAQFMGEKRYLAVKAVFEVQGHAFEVSATRSTAAGWTQLLREVGEDAEQAGEEEEAEGKEESTPFEVLSELAEGTQGRCREVKVSREKTKPLPLYTEASLLKDLKQVAKYVQDPRIKALLLDRDDGKAGERGGIGTPATRAAMLGKLRERGFYTVEKKKLVPTALGVAFIQALPRIATTPDMTALWHEQQVMIERGELSVDAFLDELEGFIGEQIEQIDLGDMPLQGSAGSEPLKVGCPMCGGELARTVKLVGCKACAFRLWPSIAGKVLASGHLESLLGQGKTGLIKGFKNKEGKAFDAALKLDAQGKVQFEFPKSGRKGTKSLSR
ncbi:TPA: topoisomerase C-terminal repeat-containing protein [Pseudomonas aeruginosa]|nr:topoisomerase C-terminal repeat-containing protein [Pseudomonas aeruginosa]HDQ4723260.1 topoisomerase C-terminal repeat-containing protein [Pseudomonas aeruginosa]